MNEGPSSSSFSNGVARTRSSRPPPPIGVVVPARDPMLAVLSLDKKNDAWVPGSVVMSAVLQGLFFISVLALTQWGLYRFTHRVDEAVHARLNVDYEIDVKEEPPPPPPEPPKEEPKPDPTPPPPQAHPVQAPPAAPQLAQAAHVLTKQEEPDKVEDMTDKFIDGTGNGGGGLTGTNGGQGFGFGKNPNPAPPGTGTALTPPPPPPPPPTVDRSRPAARQGASQWNCPWPPEADAAQIDEAYVTVSVSVRPDGAPATVNVMSDPGYGFGRFARNCAMNKRYTPALDRDGNPIGGTTTPFRIHFSR